ncbi:hypothetical protein OJAV_G00114130 [Oryzias javanicus]|uniref:Uncharacterized protein n=1 Tax=Oryzias javanicus TaxID=123683 RepID=A0A3S2P5I1_ORYJA|nr:hypothetical protein OJAV_G00114130 [Oryzias javanicus]
MPKKRSGRLSLKTTVEQQLAEVAKEILWLLQERSQTGLDELKQLVMERITAAVELILTAFEVSRAAEKPRDPDACSGADPASKLRDFCMSVSLSDGKSLDQDRPNTSSGQRRSTN